MNNIENWEKVVKVFFTVQQPEIHYKAPQVFDIYETPLRATRFIEELRAIAGMLFETDRLLKSNKVDETYALIGKLGRIADMPGGFIRYAFTNAEYTDKLVEQVRLVKK